MKISEPRNHPKQARERWSAGWPAAKLYPGGGCDWECGAWRRAWVVQTTVAAGVVVAAAVFCVVGQWRRGRIRGVGGGAARKASGKAPAPWVPFDLWTDVSRIAWSAPACIGRYPAPRLCSNFVVSPSMGNGRTSCSTISNTKPPDCILKDLFISLHWKCCPGPLKKRKSGYALFFSLPNLDKMLFLICRIIL